MKTPKLRIPYLAGILCLAAALPLHAELLVYEGFQYDPAGGAGFNPGGNPGSIPEHLAAEPDGDPGDVDATGLAGTWVENTSDLGDDWYVLESSLSFGDLATSGNKIGFTSNLDSDNATRGLTPEAQTTLSGASEIWFSLLMNPTDTRSAAAGGFGLTDNALSAGKITNTISGVAGFGIGSNASHKWRPYAWDSTGIIAGDAELDTAQGTTYLLVGHISFDTGTGGADEYSLFNYTLNGGSVVGGTLEPIGSTVEADVDQSTLDLVNFNRQVEFDADELRIGTSLADVIPTAVGGTGFADWIAGFNVGAQTGFDEDADGDGLDNGVEAFFGTAPDSFSAGLSQVAFGGGTLTFTHPEADPQLDNVTGSYEWSLDLSTWHASGDTVSGTTVTISAAQNTPSAGTTTVTATVTGTEPGKVFVRAVATQS